MEGNPTVQNSGPRREYSRVDIYVPFEFQVVPRDARNHLQSRISGYNSSDTEWSGLPSFGENDQLLGEWLKILNAKLDSIVRLLKLQRDGYFGLTSKSVNISGGGLSFHSSKEISLGDIVEIKMMLTSQQSAMVIYGEVTKMEKTQDGYLVAVRYVNMDEMVRDEIIRIVFEREREIIRGKRR